MTIVKSEQNVEISTKPRIEKTFLLKVSQSLAMPSKNKNWQERHLTGFFIPVLILTTNYEHPKSLFN